MKKDFYIRLPNLAEAQALLEEVRKAKNEDWATPIQNPFSSQVALPWSNSYLGDLDHLTAGLPRMSLDDAQRQGFQIGFHKGRFAQAAQKLEDAQFVLDEMRSFLDRPNFPAFRALYYGLQSSFYGFREAMKHSTRRIGGDAATWWRATTLRITSETVIQKLHIDYNNEKHGESTGILKPTLKLYEYEGVAPEMISGEGVFSIVNKGSHLERRVCHQGAVAEFRPYLDFSPVIINGQDRTGQPLEDQMQSIIEFYALLLFEGRKLFDK